MSAYISEDSICSHFTEKSKITVASARERFILLSHRGCLTGKQPELSGNLDSCL